MEKVNLEPQAQNDNYSVLFITKLELFSLVKRKLFYNSKESKMYCMQSKGRFKYLQETEIFLQKLIQKKTLITPPLEMLHTNSKKSKLLILTKTIEPSS